MQVILCSQAIVNFKAKYCSFINDFTKIPAMLQKQQKRVFSVFNAEVEVTFHLNSV